MSIKDVRVKLKPLSLETDSKTTIIALDIPTLGQVSRNFLVVVVTRTEILHIRYNLVCVRLISA